MNFETIETAYTLLLENVQLIQNQLGTNIYDAMIEQNSQFVAKEETLEQVAHNNHRLRELHMTPEEWRRAVQFLFIKANQTEPLQYNHQFTPDSIGFLLLFLIEQLVETDSISILEIGSGTGNLAFTLLNHSQKKLDYFGIEVDELLIDLSASLADVIGAQIGLAQGDAVRPNILKESHIILSDLPIGYYPDDQIASRYQVASTSEHTYAHHLLMEQSLKYLKEDGFAIFLAPNDLLTSPQSELLKSWLTQKARLIALINLPENLFGKSHMAKSIFVLQKQTTANRHDSHIFVHPLQDLQNAHEVEEFTKKFKKWKLDHAI